MNRNIREKVTLRERPKPKYRRFMLLNEDGDGIRGVTVGRQKEGEKIVEFTQSFKFWLNTTYPSLSVTLSFGHFEALSRDQIADYFDWHESKRGIEFLNENGEYKEEA